MSRFIAEKDPEFDDQAIVVELSDDPDVNGRWVGWCTGPEALDCADTVAQIINRRGHQPLPSQAKACNYTPRPGCEF